MKNQVDKVIKNTNGKKTTSVAALSVLFEMLMILKPGLFDANAQAAIRLGINSGLFMSLFHKIWRNRKEITEWVKSLFTNK